MQKQILIMGFYYSGSSAIYDYFIQYNRVEPFMDIGEAMLFRNILNDIWESFVYGRECNYDTIKHRCMCVNDESIYTSPYQKKQSIYMLRRFDKDEMNLILSGFFNRAKKAKTIQDFMKCGRYLTSSFIDMIEYSEFLIFDQNPDGIRPDMITLYENPYAFATIRDPKDNYFDLKTLRGMGLDEFIEMYKSKVRVFDNRMIYLKAISPEYYNRIKVIEFEKFVLDKDIREMCKNFVGIDSDIDEQKFFTQESKENIGIHRELDKGTNKRIDEELSEYRELLVKKYVNYS